MDALDTELSDVTVTPTRKKPPPPPKPELVSDRRCWNEFGGDPRRSLARPDAQLGLPKQKPMWLRSTLVPTANIGSSAGYIVMIGGLLFQSANMIYLGAVLFSAVLLFQIVTLPVEFDASSRAKRLAVENGIVLPQEREGIDRVLNAAAMTYVAAAVGAVGQMVYWLMMLLGRRHE